MTTAVPDSKNGSTPTEQGTSAAPAVLFQLTMGTFVAQAVSTAARLGVADVLADGPCDLRTIAEEVEADASTLYRLLRALGDFGVFTELPDRHFALTPVGALLQSDAPGSVRAWATMVGLPFHRNAWTDLYESVRTGVPAFARVHGDPLFDYLKTHAEDAATFNQAMSGVASQLQAGFLEAYDFTPFTTVVDVGAGNGSLLAAVLAAHPTMHGVLFDLATVTAGAASVLSRAGVVDRCTVTSGDFMVAVPQGGDLYVLSNVVHDWDDDTAVRILRTVRNAMGSDARLLLVEAVLPDTAEPSIAKLVDLEMLALTAGGRQRTDSEYAVILQKAGFAVTQTLVACAANRGSYVEATPRPR